MRLFADKSKKRSKAAIRLLQEYSWCCHYFVHFVSMDNLAMDFGCHGCDRSPKWLKRRDASSLRD